MVPEATCRRAGLNCDFRVEGDDEAHVIDVAKAHVRMVHDMKLCSDDVRGLMLRS